MRIIRAVPSPRLVDDLLSPVFTLDNLNRGYVAQRPTPLPVP